MCYAAMLCSAMLYFCSVMFFFAVLRFAVLCCPMLCFAMLGFAMPCVAAQCSALVRSRVSFFGGAAKCSHQVGTPCRIGLGNLSEPNNGPTYPGSSKAAILNHFWLQPGKCPPGNFDPFLAPARKMAPGGSKTTILSHFLPQPGKCSQEARTLQF